MGEKEKNREIEEKRGRRRWKVREIVMVRQRVRGCITIYTTRQRQRKKNIDG